MNLVLTRAILLTSGLALLSACKAEKVEISLDSATVVAAAQGQSGEADFETSVGERYTTIDDEKRALIGSVQSKFEKYFAGADIEVDIGSDEYEIDLEGSLPVSATQPSTGSPWYVSCTPAPDGKGVIVQLLPSGTFEGFAAELEEVNSMIGPDKYQPVEFRFTAQTGTLIFGGAIVDGVPTGLARIEMNGQTVKMLFSEGVWEQTSGTFLYLP